MGVGGNMLDFLEELLKLAGFRVQVVPENKPAGIERGLFSFLQNLDDILESF